MSGKLYCRKCKGHRNSRWCVGSAKRGTITVFFKKHRAPDLVLEWGDLLEKKNQWDTGRFR